MELPPHAARLALEWGFFAREELPGGHCCRIFADASSVLKVPLRGEELTYGAAASIKLAGAGGPRIVRSDPETGTVLMERLIPGTDLSTSDLDDGERQAIFGGLAQAVARLGTSGAMPLAEYVGFPHPLLDRLEDTTQERVFLHGDLHHGNILFDGGTWRPIDPKGLVGDRHYECVAYLRNPIDELRGKRDLLRFTEGRIRSLARRLDLDPWRIAAWGLLDRQESDDTQTDDPWTRLKHVYVDLEKRLRP